MVTSKKGKAIPFRNRSIYKVILKKKTYMNSLQGIKNFMHVIRKGSKVIKYQRIMSIHLHMCN